MCYGELLSNLFLPGHYHVFFSLWILRSEICQSYFFCNKCSLNQYNITYIIIQYHKVSWCIIRCPLYLWMIVNGHILWDILRQLFRHNYILNLSIFLYSSERIYKGQLWERITSRNRERSRSRQKKIIVL